MSWSAFKSDLSYEYTRFLLKSLNNHESAFMKYSRDQVDNVVNRSIGWINDNTELLGEFKDRDEWLEYYYDDSLIEEILISFIGRTDTTLNNLISDFYRTGQRISYNHMGVDYGFHGTDKRALSNLQSYVGSVRDSILGEVGYGLIDTIGDNIEKRSLDNLKKDIIKLPYTRIDHHITPDTRVLFMTKTEYARSVNTGLLQSYSNYGVDLYDWVTSGYSNTCRKCLEYERNSPYTLNEINDILCPHVNCVCSVKARLPKTLYLQDTARVIDLTPQKE